MNPHAILIHIVVADATTSDSLALLVHQAGLVFAVHKTIDSFRESFDPHRACCLILDLRLPGDGGPDLLADLEPPERSLPTLVLVDESDVDGVVLATRRGAVGCLAKPPDAVKLADLLDRMTEKAAPMAAQRQDARTARDLLRKLTPREREVFDLLVRARSAKEVANELGLSPRTAHIHRMNVLRKLRVETVIELHRVAVLLRVVSPN